MTYSAVGGSPVSEQRYRPVRGPAVAAVVLIAVAAVGDLVSLLLPWRDYLVVHDGVTGPPDVDDLFSLAIALPVSMVTLAAGVVFLVWLWRARINAERLGGQYPHRRSRGWVIGGWFCPVVNLWFPYQIVVDIWRASAPRRPVPAGLVTAWWSLCLGSLLVCLVPPGIGPEVTESGLLVTAILSTLFVPLDLAAGVLIILIIKRVTEWQSTSRTYSGQLLS